MLKLHKVVLVLFKLAVYFSFYTVLRELISFLSPVLADSIAFLFTILLIITNRGKLTDLIQKVVDKSFQYIIESRQAKKLAKVGEVKDIFADKQVEEEEGMMS